ncbi:hypothetical protein DICPUDRAFT_156889 [Dictyostelium purpureum]|uniref:PCI domain-containing protein n=1 Tax=Dictyostelium purpureum TaxID=5786 RepID=F0ZXP7_DICPU|nr:uncharacterized protein DICPUDRAFT_156889 [Dictyostelium purpureum]EGC31284.1 hypothetical protein DICPUDRAFT_156889 [Dictyostelium purpureum]|eukprot:XP_003292193.1 hypothetical protein DICPUDRAFT_156889 [Dictyostelium purpureum]
MNDLAQHLNKINDCINNCNGFALATEFSTTEIITSRLYKTYNTLSAAKKQQIQIKLNRLQKIDSIVKRQHDIDVFVSNKLPQHYNEAASNRLRCISAIFESQYSEAFKHLTEAINSFVKVFELWSSNVLWKLSLDLRLLAELATEMNDDNNLNNSNKIDYYEEASRTLLSKCFQATNADRTANMAESKKNAALGVVNQLFHIYFKINNLKLCKNLINAVESPGFPSLDTYPLSQLITYRFFNGRLSVFNGAYKKAQQDLLFAFSKCPQTSFKNKRLILLFLVPMQLEQCKFPKKSLLEKYKLNQFIDIVQAIKTGNIKQFNDCLSTHQNFFISKGIYLILEKLKIICYRNLFKKVYLIHSGQRIPINNFLSALKWMENDSIDIDETECILSNLIYNGYLKGYISHKVALVVSPTNPFPKLPL